MDCCKLPFFLIESLLTIFQCLMKFDVDLPSNSTGILFRPEILVQLIHYLNRKSVLCKVVDKCNQLVPKTNCVPLLIPNGIS